MKKRITPLAIIIYTTFNLYIFGSFTFHQGWNYELLLNNGGMMLFALVLSIFLNTALIVYYSKKYDNR